MVTSFHTCILIELFVGYYQYHADKICTQLKALYCHVFVTLLLENLIGIY